MPKWVSIEDALPIPYKRVLVNITGDSPEVYVSYLDHLGEWVYNGQYLYETSWYQEVTHWAELPLPPKEGE